MEKGYVHVYYGDGKGKTSAAVGLGVRAAGAGLKVYMVQFLKDNAGSELKSLKNIKNFSLGDAPAALPFYFMMSDKEREQYNRYARSLFASAVSACQQHNIDLVVFDEILDAVSLNIIDEDDLLSFLSARPAGLEVVLTGRSASPEIKNIADYVSKISAEKHPFQLGLAARKGIEY